MITAAILVTGGFLIGVTPSATITVAASQAGLIYGALSALAIAVHAVLVGAALPKVNGSALELAYWTNAGTAALLAPVVLLNGEGAKVLAGSQMWMAGLAQADNKINWSVFIIGSLVTGVFGFLLCISTLISIKVCSCCIHAGGILMEILKRSPALLPICSLRLVACRIYHALC